MFAVLNITDKVVMSGLGLRVRSFLLFIGFQTAITGLVIAIVNPYPSLPAETWIRGFGIGILWGVGSPLILWSLSREEISRVTPISQSHPLLTVILAVVLLGESLSALEVVAATLAIGGALLAAVKFAKTGGKFTLSSTVGYLVIAVIFVSLGQTLVKTVTDDLSFWHVLGLRGAGMGMVLIPMNLRRDIAADLIRFARGTKTSFALAIDAGAATVALALITYSIANGPLSLTSAIIGTTPLVVFFMSAILASKTRLLLDETLTRKVMTQKLVAASMVVTGIVIIALV